MGESFDTGENIHNEHVYSTIGKRQTENVQGGKNTIRGTLGL